MTFKFPSPDVAGRKPHRAGWLLAACVIGLSGPAMVQASEKNEGPASVEMTVHGPVLATPEGKTLYWTPSDERTAEETRCDNTRHAKYRHVTSQEVYLPHPETRKSCEEKWPPFMAPADAKPQGKWLVLERPDGSRQWAYEGHPLHTSIKDQHAGEANGLSVKTRSYGGWRLAMAPLAMPPGIGLFRLREGLVLTTKDQRVLYTPTAGRPPCPECDDNLEPLVAGALVNRVGEWTVVDAAGGLRQYAFRDKPVFVAPDSVTGPLPQQIDGWTPIFFQRATPTPPAIETRFSLIGDIYTNRDGMALYVFTCEEGPRAVPCDDRGDAAAHWSIICGAMEYCAQRWRPYAAAPDAKPSGEWTIATIPHPVFTDSTGFTYGEDNHNPVVRVWAFRGRPVYTFADDDEPGQVLGHRMTGLPGSGFYAIQAAGNHETTLSQ